MGHINDVIKLPTAPSHVFHYGDWQNMGTPGLSEGFDIYFPHETESRFHCLSSCLLHSLDVQTHCASASSADGIHETSSCRILVSSRCQRICRAWQGARKPRTSSLVHLLWQPKLFCVFISVSRKREHFHLKFRIPSELMFFNGMR